MRLFRRCREIFFLLSVIFLMFLFSEMVMRVYLFGFYTALSYSKMSDSGIRETGYVQLSDNVDICYEYKPNVRGYVHKAWFETNSQGLRDKEYSVEKPDDVYRIAVVGDSFTMGHGINIDDTWHSILERKGIKINGKSIELINFAIEGHDLVPNYMALLKDKVLTYNPDMIMIGFFTGNDVPTRDLEKSHFCDFQPQELPAPNPFFHSYFLERSLIFLNSFKRHKKLPGYEIFKVGEESKYHERGAWLSAFSGVGYDYNIKVYDDSWKLYGFRELSDQFENLANLGTPVIPITLIVYPELTGDPDYRFSPDIRIYYSALYYGCKSKFKVIDTLPVLESYDLSSLTVSRYDNHFNEKANALIADRVAEKLGLKREDLCFEIAEDYSYAELIPVVTFGASLDKDSIGYPRNPD